MIDNNSCGCAECETRHERERALITDLVERCPGMYYVAEFGGKFGLKDDLAGDRTEMSLNLVEFARLDNLREIISLLREAVWDDGHLYWRHLDYVSPEEV